MNIIEHNEVFVLAFRFVTETNETIFLTGKAGTGKTTFLKYLKENCTKNIVVAAPTGVAAINAGGVTLHSLFQLPFHPFLPTGTGKVELLAKARFFFATANAAALASIQYNLPTLLTTSFAQRPLPHPRSNPTAFGGS